ncbi:MAG TPA: hypothetical protein VFS31_12805 [Chitinophagaceae bacterium]|jgi:hypothetical protein|nr:hypothetical protein [Chitinophagaceae bacterium]
MLLIAVSFNIVWLAPVALFCAFLGFAFRSKQLSAKQAKITELEREVMTSHAEILELQKANAGLEQQLRDKSIPVIPISASKEEKKPESKVSENPYNKKQAAAE